MSGTRVSQHGLALMLAQPCMHWPSHRHVSRGAGRTVTQKDVEKLNAKLTIQLDNLCQFLPQEKVVEFSKMTPTELLLSTEQAIGDGSLHQMHTRLISGGKELEELNTTLCALPPATHPERLREPLLELTEPVEMLCLCAGMLVPGCCVSVVPGHRLTGCAIPLAAVSPLQATQTCTLTCRNAYNEGTTRNCRSLTISKHTCTTKGQQGTAGP